MMAFSIRLLDNSGPFFSTLFTSAFDGLGLFTVSPDSFVE